MVKDITTQNEQMKSYLLEPFEVLCIQKRKVIMITLIVEIEVIMMMMMMMMIVVKIIIILRLKMILIIMMIIIIILLIIVLCQFSTSCRWAFGILLWEIVTFGK